MVRIVRILYNLFVAAIANIILISIATFKRQNTRFLIICYPLGDTCYGLAFSRYLQSKGKCRYIVCKNQKRLIEECYPHISADNIFYYKRKGFLNQVFLYISFKSYINRFYGRFNITATIPYAYYKGGYYIQDSYLNYLRKMFGLSNAIPSERPHVKLRECIIPMGKIAILNPFSNSMHIDNEKYWEDISLALLAKGYNVYTNVVKGQKPIENTQALDCNIFDLYNIVHRNRALFLSIRSGIVDFLIGSDGIFFVVYYLNETIPSKSLRNFCNLTKWEHGKDNVLEVESNDSMLLLKTHQFIEKYS